MAPVIIKSPQYTLEQRVYMVEQKMAKNSQKIINDNFKRRFPFSGRSPAKKVVWKQVKKFKTAGTLHNLNKGNSGRKKTVLTDQNLNLML